MCKVSFIFQLEEVKDLCMSDDCHWKLKLFVIYKAISYWRRRSLILDGSFFGDLKSYDLRFKGFES